MRRLEGRRDKALVWPRIPHRRQCSLYVVDSELLKSRDEIITGWGLLVASLVASILDRTSLPLSEVSRSPIVSEFETHVLGEVAVASRTSFSKD